MFSRALRITECRFRDQVTEGLWHRGYRELRLSHIETLKSLQGGRAVTAATLAREQGVTKQAVSQTLGELVAWGYVARSEDIWDKRSDLLVLSRKGEHLLGEIEEVLEGIEREHRAMLGDEGYEQLMVALEVLARGES